MLLSSLNKALVYNKYQPTRVALTNVGIGLHGDPAASPYLGLSESQFLVVGEGEGGTYSLAVDATGVSMGTPLLNRAVDAHRLRIDGDVWINGTITASNVNATNLVTGGNFANRLDANNQSVWKFDPANACTFYDHRAVVGASAATAATTSNVMRVVGSTNDWNAAQFRIDCGFAAPLNAHASPPATLSLGVMGVSSASPALVHTTPGMDIVFLAGCAASDVNRFYNFPLAEGGTRKADVPYFPTEADAPHLLIDCSGGVGIHTGKVGSYTYYRHSADASRSYAGAIVTEKLALDVRGALFASNIFMYDYVANAVLPLDEQFFRKDGVTFAASNVIPSDFAQGAYRFPCNVAVAAPRSDLYALNVGGNAQFGGDAYFRGDVDAKRLHASNLDASIATVQNDMFVHDRLLVDGGIFVKVPNKQVRSTENSNVPLAYFGVDYDASSATAVWMDQFGSPVLGHVASNVVLVPPLATHDTGFLFPGRKYVDEGGRWAYYVSNNKIFADGSSNIATRTKYTTDEWDAVDTGAFVASSPNDTLLHPYGTEALYLSCNLEYTVSTVLNPGGTLRLQAFGVEVSSAVTGTSNVAPTLYGYARGAGTVWYDSTVDVPLPNADATGIKFTGYLNGSSVTEVSLNYDAVAQAWVDDNQNGTVVSWSETAFEKVAGGWQPANGGAVVANLHGSLLADPVGTKARKVTLEVRLPLYESTCAFYDPSGAFLGESPAPLALLAHPVVLRADAYEVDATAPGGDVRTLNPVNFAHLPDAVAAWTNHGSAAFIKRSEVTGNFYVGSGNAAIVPVPSLLATCNVLTYVTADVAFRAIARDTYTATVDALQVPPATGSWTVHLTGDPLAGDAPTKFAPLGGLPAGMYVEAAGLSATRLDAPFVVHFAPDVSANIGPAKLVRYVNVVTRNVYMDGGAVVHVPPWVDCPKVAVFRPNVAFTRTANVLVDQYESVNFVVASGELSNVSYFGTGVSMAGRFGCGIYDGEAVDNQLVAKKHEAGIFELELTDVADPDQAVVRSLFVGHRNFDRGTNAPDYCSVVFATPSMKEYDWRYTPGLTHIPAEYGQNIYFLPGYDFKNCNMDSDAALAPTLALMAGTGFVGVNTRAPQSALHVVGDIRFTGNLVDASASSLTFFRLANGVAVYDRADAAGVAVFPTDLASVAGSGYGLTVGRGIKAEAGVFSSDDYQYAEVLFYDETKAHHPELQNQQAFMLHRLSVGKPKTDATLEVYDPRPDAPSRLRVTNNGASSEVFVDLVMAAGAVEEAWSLSADRFDQTFRLGRPDAAAAPGTSAISAVYNADTGRYRVGINTSLDTVSFPSSTEPALVVNGDLLVTSNINVLGSYCVNGRVVINAASDARSTPQAPTIDLGPDDVFIGGNNVYVNPLRTFKVTSQLQVYDAVDPATLAVTDFRPLAQFLSDADRGYLEFGKAASPAGRIQFRYDDDLFQIRPGNFTTCPFITFQKRVFNSAYYKVSVNALDATIATDSTNAVFHVVDPTLGSADAMHLSCSVNGRLDPGCPRVSLAKHMADRSRVAWTLRSPDAAFNNKLSFLLTDTTSPTAPIVDRELVTFTDDGHVGINSARPQVALDICNATAVSAGSTVTVRATAPGVPAQVAVMSSNAAYGLVSSNMCFSLTQRVGSGSACNVIEVDAMGNVGVGRAPSGAFDLDVQGRINVSDGLFVDGVAVFTRSAEVYSISNDKQFLSPGYNPAAGRTGGLYVGFPSLAANTCNLFYVHNSYDGNLCVLQSDTPDCHLNLYAKPSSVSQYGVTNEAIARMGVSATSNAWYLSMKPHMAQSASYFVDPREAYEDVLRFERDAGAAATYSGRVAGGLAATGALRGGSVTDGVATLARGTVRDLVGVGVGTHAPAAALHVFAAAAAATAVLVQGASNVEVDIFAGARGLGIEVALATGDAQVRVCGADVLRASSTALDVQLPASFGAEASFASASAQRFAQSGLALRQDASGIAYYASRGAAPGVDLLRVGLGGASFGAPVDASGVEVRAKAFADGFATLTGGILSAPTVKADALTSLKGGAVSVDNLTVTGLLKVTGSQTTIDSVTTNSHQVNVLNAGTGTALVVDQLGADASGSAVLDVRFHGSSVFVVDETGTVGVGLPMADIDTSVLMHVGGDVLVASTLTTSNLRLLEGGSIRDGAGAGLFDYGAGRLALRELASGPAMTLVGGALSNVAGMGVGAPSRPGRVAVGDYAPAAAPDLVAFASASSNTSLLTLTSAEPAGPAPLELLQLVRPGAGAGAASARAALALCQSGPDPSGNDTLASRTRLDVRLAGADVASPPVTAMTFACLPATGAPMVGIGTTNPRFTLDVAGDLNVSGRYFHAANGVNINNTLILDPGTMTMNNPNIVMTSVYVGVGTTSANPAVPTMPLDVYNYTGDSNLGSFATAAATGVMFFRAGAAVSALEVAAGSATFRVGGADALTLRPASATLGGSLQVRGGSVGLVRPGASGGSWQAEARADGSFAVRDDVKGADRLVVDASGNVSAAGFAFGRRDGDARTLALGEGAPLASPFVHFYGAAGCVGIGTAAYPFQFQFQGGQSTTALDATYKLLVAGKIACVAVASFTGQHLVAFNHPNWKDDYVGLIVSLTGRVLDDAVDVDQSVAIVEFPRARMDRKAYGVLSSCCGGSAYGYMCLVNSVGEGAMWVCDVNGPVDTGDYIAASLIVGYGMAQGDDALRGCTVAKACARVNFAAPPKWLKTKSFRFKDPHDREVKNVTAVLVPVTYHCG